MNFALADELIFDGNFSSFTSLFVFVKEVLDSALAIHF